MIFNLDHEMETLHFISNGEDPYPGESGKKIEKRRYFGSCEKNRIIKLK